MSLGARIAHLLGRAWQAIVAACARLQRTDGHCDGCGALLPPGETPGLCWDCFSARQW